MIPGLELTFVAVIPVPGFPDRWSAAAVVNGRETSFDCGHLHHSPEAAVRCVKKVLAAWEEYVAAEDVMTAPWTVVELSVVRGGRITQWRRFTYNDEVEAAQRKAQQQLRLEEGLW